VISKRRATKMHFLNDLGAQAAVGLSKRGPHEPLPQLSPASYDTSTLEQQGRSFYHGSDSEFRPKDTIDPVSSGDTTVHGVDTGHRSWGTFDRDWAGAHGRHIYDVTPLGDVTQTWGDNWSSPHGWRVNRRVGTGSRELLRDEAAK
jgi:hypothetical protein